MRTRVIVHTPEEYESWLHEKRIAQQDSLETVAVNPAELTPSQYLAAYDADMNISSATLSQIQR